MSFKQLLAFLVLAAAPATAVAQDPLWWDLPADDPIRFSSLRFDLGRDIDPAEQRFAFDLQLGYFNEASSSWHSKTIHNEFGRQGLPIAPWELELLELRHPDVAHPDPAVAPGDGVRGRGGNGKS